MFFLHWHLQWYLSLSSPFSQHPKPLPLWTGDGAKIIPSQRPFFHEGTNAPELSFQAVCNWLTCTALAFSEANYWTAPNLGAHFTNYSPLVTVYQNLKSWISFLAFTPLDFNSEVASVTDRNQTTFPSHRSLIGLHIFSKVCIKVAEKTIHKSHLIYNTWSIDASNAALQHLAGSDLTNFTSFARFGHGLKLSLVGGYFFSCGLESKTSGHGHAFHLLTWIVSTVQDKVTVNIQHFCTVNTLVPEDLSSTFFPHAMDNICTCISSNDSVFP